jgi:hypothetical protein
MAEGNRHHNAFAEQEFNGVPVAGMEVGRLAAG